MNNEFVIRNVNFNREVHDLIQGECQRRHNGGKGFSRTVNQIILDYFAMTMIKGTTVALTPEGKLSLTVGEEKEPA